MKHRSASPKKKHKYLLVYLRLGNFWNYLTFLFSGFRDGCLVQKMVVFIIFFSGGHQRCSIRKIFLKISQYSQENTCARVFFLRKLQAWPATLLKKRLWHTCFHVNFAKFLITSYRTAPNDCFCYFEKSESYRLCEKF